MSHLILIMLAGFAQQPEPTMTGSVAPKEAFAESAPDREKQSPEAIYNAKQQRLRDHYLQTPLGDLPEARRAEAQPLPPPQTTVKATDAEAVGLSIVQNRALTDAETNDATSTVGEPSVAIRGNEILFTGNWFACLSKNSGATYSFRNPSTTFPTIPNRPFCCDQVAIYVPSHDLMVWFLQHGRDQVGNTIRIAVAKGADIGNEQWRYYDFTPQGVGNWTEEWFDYADLAYSNKHLFLTSNVFSFSNTFKRSVALRIPLDELASYGTINYRYLHRSELGSLRPTQNAGDTMYLGSHLSTGTIRVIKWSDVETTSQSKDFNVQTWARGGSAPGPDGRDWLGFADGRITAAWSTGGQQGFAWSAANNTTFPKPHIRVALIDWNAGTVVKQPHIWSQQIPYGYIGASAQNPNRVGISLGYGGNSTLYPSHCVGLYDPAGSWTLVTTANGTHGPDTNRWGDYLTVRNYQDHFVAAGYSLSGGSNRTSVVPRIVRFRQTGPLDGSPELRPVPGNNIARDASYSFESKLISAAAMKSESTVSDTKIRFRKAIAPPRLMMPGVRESVTVANPLNANQQVGPKKAVLNLRNELESDWYAKRAKLPHVARFFYDAPESVCDPDERLQQLDTLPAPWNANCQLVITLNDDSQAIGTGWLLGPRLVVTAGHCVHEGEGGNFFKSVEVIPAMSGTLKPFGSQISSTLRASADWKTSGLQARDYGAIILAAPFQDANGQSPATLNAVVVSDGDLANGSIRISGYPADKTFGTQWFDSGAITQVLPERLRYLVDTYGGHSGSAVVRAENPSQVVGIHNYGGCPNKCTRIVGTTKADLDAWLAESNLVLANPKVNKPAVVDAKGIRLNLPKPSQDKKPVIREVKNRKGRVYRLYESGTPETKPDTDIDESIPEAGNPNDFRGTSRRHAKTGIVAASVEEFASVAALRATFVDDDSMAARSIPFGSGSQNSPRELEENRNVRVHAKLFAFKKEPDNDYHVLIGDANGAAFLNVEISGLPKATWPSGAFRAALQVPRDAFKEEFELTGSGSTNGYIDLETPVDVIITGTLFYDMDHAPPRNFVGHADLQPETAWEIHPITGIEFP